MNLTLEDSRKSFQNAYTRLQEAREAKTHHANCYQELTSHYGVPDKEGMELAGAVLHAREDLKIAVAVFQVMLLDEILGSFSEDSLKVIKGLDAVRSAVDDVECAVSCLPHSEET